MRSPSVFNFYRPGYVPPGTPGRRRRSLVAPEMQLAHETTAAGYVNYMRDNIGRASAAFGHRHGQWRQLNRRDIQPDFSAELALADEPGALVDRINSAC